MCQGIVIDQRQDIVSRKNEKLEIIPEKYKIRTYVGKKQKLEPRVALQTRETCLQASGGSSAQHEIHSTECKTEHH